MPTWLNSQKKARLAELALLCNIGTAEDLAEWRKDQLVPALEHELSLNPPLYSKIPAFDEYYQRRNSPIKRGGSFPRASTVAAAPITANGDGAPRYRRTTSVLKAEGEASDEAASSPNNHGLSSPTMAPSTTARIASGTRPLHTVSRVSTLQPSASSAFQPNAATASSNILTRTPARIQEVQRFEVAGPVAPLPPSPALVTDLIEAQSARFNAEVGDLWANTRIMEFLNQARVELSSMVGVHMAMLLLELYFLQSHVAVWKFAFDINTPIFTKAVYYPDLFVYLTGYWLSMLFTWQTMSFWIPLTVAWFCNLSLKLKARNGVEYWRPRYRVDPLTFSVTKGLVAWLVFTQGKRFWGVVSDATIDRIEAAMPVGQSGIMVASYVGVAMAIWDAVQGKKGWQ